MLNFKKIVMIFPYEELKMVDNGGGTSNSYSGDGSSNTDQRELCLQRRRNDMNSAQKAKDQLIKEKEAYINARSELSDQKGMIDIIVGSINSTNNILLSAGTINNKNIDSDGVLSGLSGSLTDFNDTIGDLLAEIAKIEEQYDEKISAAQRAYNAAYNRRC